MTTITFDTLSFAKRLQSVGVPPAQAEEQVKILAEIVDNQLATKRDIEELRAASAREIELLRRDMRDIEQRVTIRLGAMIAAGVAFLAALKLYG